MNEILEFLNSHASCRKFSDRVISPENEEFIITTAQRSPTSSNLQAYSIIGVRNEQSKQKLAELSGGQKHISDSSLFLVFCADLYRLSLLASEREYNFNGDQTEAFIIGTVDASLAACRALMAAQSLGIGGVMVGGIRNNPDDVCNLLSLPRYVYPVMGMSLGFPETQPQLKPRLPLTAIYMKERYNTDSLNESLESYDREIDKLGYLRGREITPDEYPDFAGNYSWKEHVARRMADNRPSTARPHMMKFLQKRGLLRK